MLIPFGGTVIAIWLKDYFSLRKTFFRINTAPQRTAFCAFTPKPAKQCS
ncbi:MAG: hypothetical protein WCA49_06290 [Candidatus Sulfotelmatobacter sp.]